MIMFGIARLRLSKRHWGPVKRRDVVPAILRSLGIESHQRIYLLQPRRLAARSVAERIAFEQGSAIGGKVGYQVRYDSKVSRETQLIVATEGILLRRLHEDATISDTNVVLLDEFHERSLDADLLLGMLRRIQATVRDDLRLVIMSATLDSESLREQLGSPPVVRVEGRNYPVTVQYRAPRPQQRLVEHMVDTLQEIVPRHDGDVLAFLPGAGEIHRCCGSVVANVDRAIAKLRSSTDRCHSRTNPSRSSREPRGESCSPRTSPKHR